MSTVTPQVADLLDQVIRAGSIKAGAYAAGLTAGTANVYLARARRALGERTSLAVLLRWQRLQLNGDDLPVRTTRLNRGIYSDIQTPMRELGSRPGGTTVDEIVEASGAPRGSVRTRVRQLKADGRVRVGNDGRIYWTAA